MKDSEKIDAMMMVPAPILSDAISEFLVCYMIPSLGSDTKTIEQKKQHWGSMAKAFSKGTMEDLVFVFQYETKEQMDAMVREMKGRKFTYVGFNPLQFNYITEYISEHLPNGVEGGVWQKQAE